MSVPASARTERSPVSRQGPEEGGRGGGVDFSGVPADPPRALHRYRGWARLRSMRTALWLLLVVAAASVVGSLLPQKNNSASRVEQFISDHPFWGTLFERLQFFEVFTSWWFLGLVGFLLFVLFLCLLPRSRAHLRTLGSLKVPPRRGSLPPLDHRHSFETDLGVDEALEATRAALRARRWRLSPPNDANQFVAEKGAWREGGSLLFHWALFLVFLAGAVTVATKFEGYVAIVEGRRWYEGGRVTFDDYSEGRLASLLNPHKNFYLTLEDFEARYRPDGTPEDFTSEVVLEDPSRGVRMEETIRVNKPLNYRGVKVYQASYGWAAEVRVSERATVLYEGPILFLPEAGTSGPVPPSGAVGVVKLPSTSGAQTGLELRLFPDFRLVPFRATNPDAPEAADPTALDVISVSDDPNRPLVLVTEYRGDLGMDRPQSVYRLDKRALEEVDQRFATFPGHSNDKIPDRLELGGGLVVELLELKRYSVFQVRSDTWGSGIAALAGACVFVSLFPALYSWRRRLWVQVSTAADTRRSGEGTRLSGTSSAGPTVVEVRGVAFQRKDLFDSEFAGVARSLQAALGCDRPEEVGGHGSDGPAEARMENARPERSE